jgi:hypothetical protein
MNNQAPSPADAVDLRQRALSRWDNEGGALAHGGAQTLPPEVTAALSDAELIHLRVRVIALENVVIALLATGTARQQALASEMADIIRPREGAVAHPLTLEAANLIDGLVQRSRNFADAAA